MRKELDIRNILGTFVYTNPSTDTCRGVFSAPPGGIVYYVMY